ncbi:MAG: hypothetical protein BGO38_12610 [Cellulomonas sp. 73-145]|uniref:class II aldolase/adducin family protein n=1 Tax=unclassified Cellulomonas TaxID=2620175 RepID=UPI00092AB55A|nr:class II aldolase/adducin family protein [Cellulomonas sp. 73-145]OJV59898.1 MAG: hypothetical protein BGO38_12610 [Cellulomonas sp. 73-145]
MSTSDHDLTRALDALVAACRHLATQGLSPGGSGNVSLRVGTRLLVTPTGSSLSRLTPEAVTVLEDGEVRSGGRPSKELPLHRAFLAARPELTAVVHLHSPYAVAASCLDATAPPPATGPLPALTPYQVMRLGALPVAPYAPPGSAELAQGVAALAGEHTVVLLANHGSVVAGPTLDAATDLAEELEAAARLHFVLADRPHRLLTPEQVDALRR